MFTLCILEGVLIRDRLARAIAQEWVITHFAQLHEDVHKLGELPLRSTPPQKVTVLLQHRLVVRLLNQRHLALNHRLRLAWNVEGNITLFAAKNVLFHQSLQLCHLASGFHLAIFMLKEVSISEVLRLYER